MLLHDKILAIGFVPFAIGMAFLVFNLAAVSLLGLCFVGIGILIFIISFAVSIKEWRQGKTGFWWFSKLIKRNNDTSSSNQRHSGHSTQSESFLIASAKTKPHSSQMNLQTLCILCFRIMAFMLKLDKILWTSYT